MSTQDLGIHAPSTWAAALRAQLALPGTPTYIDSLTSALHRTPLAALGPAVTRRFHSVSYLAALSIPHAHRDQHSFNLAYLAAWLYAADVMIDRCPSLHHATDFHRLLERRVELPLDAEIAWSDLDLREDPRRDVPGSSFSTCALVEALQPLRESVAAASTDRGGLEIFDHLLVYRGVPASIAETRWRLDGGRPRDLAHYLDVSSETMCGHISASIVNATLPDPMQSWLPALATAEKLNRALRLLNDFATVDTDTAEGAVNSLDWLDLGGGTRSATSKGRALLAEYEREVEALCLPHLMEPESGAAGYILNFYFYHCLAACEVMYASRDFVAPSQHA